MQEAYLVPTECARLLSGPNPALPFLPKSTSSSSHQGNLYQTGHSINRAPSPRAMCPSGRLELGVSPPGCQGFCICLPRQTFLLFSHPQTRRSRRAVCASCRAQTRGLPGFPQPPFKQGSFTGQGGQGMDQDKDHNFATPGLKSERD